MSVFFVAITGLALAAWLYLLSLHGGFWRADQRLAAAPAAPDTWPPVVAVVPARDEAAGVGDAFASLLAQDYPGRFSTVLVDDHSTDGTGDIARAVAGGAKVPAEVLTGQTLAPGWTGKLWALHQGIAHAAATAGPEGYWWLTDADIVHPPDTLRRLVAKAEAENRDLVSLMVRLDSAGAWPALLIPAFVFFFQKLYPFPRVNRPGHPTAAAAGGCMLLRRSALARAGGLERIGDALIDDCALARLIQDARRPGSNGLWLGLADGSRSIRVYDTLGEIWNMVARTAYTQLRHSPWLLAGTLLGMTVLYLVPPIGAVLGAITQSWTAAGLGLAAWSALSFAFLPTLRLYRRPLALAPLLPLAGLLYSLMTVSSALRHWRGRGGQWKGRAQAGGAATG